MTTWQKPKEWGDRLGWPAPVGSEQFASACAKNCQRSFKNLPGGCQKFNNISPKNDNTFWRKRCLWPLRWWEHGVEKMVDFFRVAFWVLDGSAASKCRFARNQETVALGIFWFLFWHQNNLRSYIWRSVDCRPKKYFTATNPTTPARACPLFSILKMASGGPAGLSSVLGDREKVVTCRGEGS